MCLMYFDQNGNISSKSYIFNNLNPSSASGVSITHVSFCRASLMCRLEPMNSLNSRSKFPIRLVREVFKVFMRREEYYEHNERK